MTVTIYGISNCDTVRKARKWLQAQEIDFSFHDFRKDGLEPSLLSVWVEELGWETLLNKRGTTWRKLPDEQKADINQDSATALMLQEPTLIKRPVIDTGSQKQVGFSTDSYQQLFS